LSGIDEERGKKNSRVPGYILILQAPPNLHPFILKGLVRTKTFFTLRGGPEPLENEINKILRSKREDRFSDHFSDLVQNICSVRFSYLLRLSIFCKAPTDMRKFPQKCKKIAGC